MTSPQDTKMRLRKRFITMKKKTYVYIIIFPFHYDLIEFEEVVNVENYRKVMDKEINNIERKKVWELVDLTKGNDFIGVKWFFKTKFNIEGEVEKYNARLAVIALSNYYEIYYNSEFKPIVRIDTFRVFLDVTTQNDLKFY